MIGRTDDARPREAMRLARVWLPTAFGASMLVLEIPLVYAAVARTTGGAQALAATGICVSLLVVVNTPALALTPLVAVEDERRGLRRYALAVGATGSALLLALAVLPAAGQALTAVFGLDDELRRQVRDGLLGLAPNALGVALRRELHGRFVLAGRTGPIMTATAARIVGTGAVAWLAITIWPDRGALAAGCALSAGALLETALLAVAARRLPARPLPRRFALRPVAVRHAQLSTGRLLATVPMLITTVGIAHSAEAPASLVVWPALYELLMLFCSPTVDWASVAAPALRRDRTSPAPRRVAVWLAAAFGAAFALVLLAGPGRAYLRDVLAVPTGPAELGLRWAPVLLAVPVLWVVRTHLHGVLMADGRTGIIVPAGAVHVLVLAATAAALAATPLPGVAAAATAMTAGMLADVTVTAWSTRRGVALPGRPPAR